MVTRHDNCVVLVCNRGFLAPALFIAHQLTQEPCAQYDVVIASAEDLGDAITAPVIFRKFEATEFVNGLPEDKRLGQYTYWRIPAIDSLTLDYQKILYLDADVFCCRASISGIFSIDLGGNPLAAVRDVHQSVRPGRKTRESAILGIESRPYFNAGVLLVSSKNWRLSGCYEKIREIAKTRAHALVCHDQSLLNLMTEGNWVELSPIWNWQYSYRNCFLTDWVLPYFVHFSGERKLWHAPDGMIPRRYWEAFRAFNSNVLKAPMGDRYPALDPSLRKSLGRSMLKNAWYARSYFRYLRRFPDELSIVEHRAT